MKFNITYYYAISYSPKLIGYYIFKINTRQSPLTSYKNSIIPKQFNKESNKNWTVVFCKGKMDYFRQRQSQRLPVHVDIQFKFVELTT